MFTVHNSEYEFLRLIDGHSNPVKPLLRYNVLMQYRRILSYMIHYRMDDDYVLEYMNGHEHTVLIDHPINDIEKEQNEQYLDYIYSKNSIQTMLAKFKELDRDPIEYTKTLTNIYHRCLERESRYIPLTHMDIFKKVIPDVNLKLLISRYCVTLSKDIGNRFQAIRWSIDNNIIDENSLDVVIDCIMNSENGIVKKKFITHFSDFSDSYMNDEFTRLYNRINLLNRWTQ